MAPARAHVIVHGDVQGVGFRYTTVREAGERGLTGWVRNTWQGTVEAVFEGEKNDVEDMVAWCRRGPVSAEVTKVDVTWEEPAQPKFKSFSIKY